MKHLFSAVTSFVWFVSFWGFITIKVAGTSFAAWSWAWMFIPLVPFFGLLVQHYQL